MNPQSRLKGTLAEWLQRNPTVYVQSYGAIDWKTGKLSGSKALQVFANTDFWALYHLTDYVVTASVSGPSYVLVPRETSYVPIAGN